MRKLIAINAIVVLVCLALPLHTSMPTIISEVELENVTKIATVTVPLSEKPDDSIAYAEFHPNQNQWSSWEYAIIIFVIMLGFFGQIYLLYRISQRQQRRRDRSGPDLDYEATPNIVIPEEPCVVEEEPPAYQQVQSHTSMYPMTTQCRLQLQKDDESDSHLPSFKSYLIKYKHPLDTLKSSRSCGTVLATGTATGTATGVADSSQRSATTARSTLQKWSSLPNAINTAHKSRPANHCRFY